MRTFIGSMRMRGTESYEARRELMFGDDKIVLIGKATNGADALELEVDISGKISLLTICAGTRST